MITDTGIDVTTLPTPLDADGEGDGDGDAGSGVDGGVHSIRFCWN